MSWNARGLYDKKTQLIQLINKTKADIVLVQETLINEQTLTGKKNKFKMEDFMEFPFHRNSKNDQNRGLSIFVRKGIHYEEIESKSLDLLGQYQTIKLFDKNDVNKTSFYITNMYLKQKVKTERILLEDLLGKYEKHIISGDANSFNPSWSPLDSSSYAESEKRGDLIRDIIDDSEMSIINTGEITHISDTLGQRPSAIDLTIVTDNLLSKRVTWRVAENTLGSDHFPQIITLNEQLVNDYNPPSQLRFKTDKADWEGYKIETRHSDLWDNITITNDVIESNRNICGIIREAAIKTIPSNFSQINCDKSSEKINKKNFIKTCFWWNRDCEIAKTKRNFWQKRYLKNRLWMDHQELKAAQKDLQTLIKDAKDKAYLDMTKSLDINSRPKEVWAHIKAIDGSAKSGIEIPTLKYNNSTAITETDKANAIGNCLFKTSSDEMTAPEFREEKEKLRKQPFWTDKDETDDKDYNRPFTMSELDTVLRRKKKEVSGRK